MNNDNEKELIQDTTPEEETIEETVEETVDEPTEASCDEAEEKAEGETCSCGCCEHICDMPEYDTVAVEVPTSPKRSIMTPIIIAAVALVAVAALVFGGLTIYKAFFGNDIDGVWVEKGYEDSGVYFEFDEGNAYLRGGGISYYGTYETMSVDLNSGEELSESLQNLVSAENLSGKINVLKTDFYVFGLYGSEYLYTLDTVDGTKTITLKYMDAQSGSVAEWVFVKTELPKYELNAEKFSNASADEAGVKPMTLDKNIVGTWSEADYGTYTFYDDGTANYKTNYQVDQTYAMFYGVTMGYGIDLDFTYTVGDGIIYMSVGYYAGDDQSGTMTYYLDGDNLVLDGVGYAKVK